MHLAVAEPSLGVTRVFKLMSKCFKEISIDAIRVGMRVRAMHGIRTGVDVAQVPRDTLATVLSAEVGVSVLAEDHTGGDTGVSADDTTLAATSSAVVSVAVATGTAPGADTLLSKTLPEQTTSEHKRIGSMQHRVCVLRREGQLTI